MPGRLKTTERESRSTTSAKTNSSSSESLPDSVRLGRRIPLQPSRQYQENPAVSFEITGLFLCLKREQRQRAYLVGIFLFISLLFTIGLFALILFSCFDGNVQKVFLAILSHQTVVQKAG